MTSHMLHTGCEALLGWLGGQPPTSRFDGMFCQLMPGIFKVQCDCGASVGEQGGQSPCIFLGHDRIISPGEHQHRDSIQFRENLGHQRNHGTKQSGSGENARSQQKQARGNIRAVGIANRIDPLGIQRIARRCLGNEVGKSLLR